MINTILLGLLYASFLFERLYFYIYFKNKNEPLLNFNQNICRPLNIDERIEYPNNNTNITEYIMSQPPHVCL